MDRTGDADITEKAFKTPWNVSFLSKYTVPIALCVLITFTFFFLRRRRSKTKDGDSDAKDQKDSGVSGNVESHASNSVAKADAAYLARTLGPDATHWEVLYRIATTPENIAVTSKTLKKIAGMRAQKVASLEKKKKEEAARSSEELDFSMAIDIDGGGWADDDDEDGSDDEKGNAMKAAAAAARREEEEKRMNYKNLRATMGEPDMDDLLLEGIDEGVLGQQWILEQLSSRGKWPPQLFDPSATYFDPESGEVLTALEHPAVVRNLIMTLSRIHAVELNAIPQLVKTIQQGRLDPTYFKNSLEFRQRNGLILEAALRVACSLRSHRLVCTILEAVTMFKAGAPSVNDPAVLQTFRRMLAEPHGGVLPKLAIGETSVKSVTQPDSASSLSKANPNTCELTIAIDRLHAEAFTQKKLEVAKAQGIPPKVALLSPFREVWWVLVRAEPNAYENEDDDDPFNVEEAQSNNVPEAFLNEDESRRLLCAWPFVIDNVAKKSGTAKVKMLSPRRPGRYTFFVTLKSQDFVGCDPDEFSIPNVEVQTGRDSTCDDEGKDGEDIKKYDINTNDTDTHDEDESKKEK